MKSTKIDSIKLKDGLIYKTVLGNQEILLKSENDKLFYSIDRVNYKELADNKDLENIIYRLNSNELVKTTPQDLTEVQQRQAKINIGSYKDFKYNFVQLLEPNVYKTWNNNGYKVTNNLDGSVTINEGDITQRITFLFDTSIPLNSNHKYYLSFNNNQTSFVYNGVYSVYNSNIITNVSSITQFEAKMGNTIKDITFSPILIDLTQMFGAGNEPTSVEEVQQYLVPNKYYPYGINIEPSMYVTKGEVNSLSMCPSDTIVLNPIIGNITTTWQTYTAPSNGILKLVIYSRETVTFDSIVGNEEQLTISTIRNNYSMYNFLLRKGQIFKYKSNKNNALSFSKSLFIHAKEI